MQLSTDISVSLRHPLPLQRTPRISCCGGSALQLLSLLGQVDFPHAAQEGSYLKSSMQKSWCNSIEGNAIFSKVPDRFALLCFAGPCSAVRRFQNGSFLVCISCLWIPKAAWVMGPAAHVEMGGLLLLWL